MTSEEEENMETMIYIVQTAAVVITRVRELGQWIYHSHPLIGLITDQTLYQYKQFRCYYLGMSCEPNYKCYFLSTSLNEDFSAVSIGLRQEYISRENYAPFYEYSYYLGLLSKIKLTVQKIQPYYLFRETAEQVTNTQTMDAVHESGVRFLAISYSHPDMDEPITIEIPSTYYLVHNVIFSATFIRWWLEYNVSPDDYVFDHRYEVSLMDTDFKVTTLHMGQSIQLHSNGYTVLPIQMAEYEEIEESIEDDSCKSAQPEYQFETIEKKDVPAPATDAKCRWFFW